VKAGIFVASSIKVAEAAKVIENTQRDLNIALMNELVKIFDAMDISTNEVLEAASTKWNFLNFHPGLVGGHCIGVDPYYLIHKSQQIGVIPDLLISARKINDSMSSYFSMKIFNILNEKKVEINKSKILILGITFKENCPDTRNSKVVDLFKELKTFRSNVDIYDPIVNVKEFKNEYGIDILNIPPKKYYDIVVITVGHQIFTDLGEKEIRKWCKSGGIIMDLKNTISKNEVDFTL
jgi:UDP-N-acetyl-D-galactosamine dehydrogenase